MRDELNDKGYRDAFVEENIKAGIAFQVRALREHNEWAQKELGRRAAKPQNVISRIEDPDYGKYTIRTLLDLASAFDVALLVKFVSYGELAMNMKSLSPDALAVPSFEEEKTQKSQYLNQLSKKFGLLDFGNKNLRKDELIFSKPRPSGARAALVSGNQPQKSFEVRP